MISQLETGLASAPTDASLGPLRVPRARLGGGVAGWAFPIRLFHPQLLDRFTDAPQKNFTDPESRIMLDGATKAFQQAFNAQIAVDGDSQIILAAAVTQDTTDNGQLAPMLMAVQNNIGRLPEIATADNGYFNPAAITDPRLASVDLYVATARERKIPAAVAAPTASAQRPPDVPLSVVQRMRNKLATPEGQAIYKRRKCIPEPVFGQIKEVRGFRRFSFRGHDKVEAEWSIVALTHNLLKLFRSGWKSGSIRSVMNGVRSAVCGS